MTDEPAHLSDCADPSQGKRLDDYFEKRLTPEEASAFEEHYLECRACREELQLMQALPAALREASRREATRSSQTSTPGPDVTPRLSRSPNYWLWLGAAVGIAAVAATILILPRVLRPAPPPNAEPYVLHLAGNFRTGGAETARSAPANRSLELRLFVSIPQVQGVTYDVRVEKEHGGWIHSVAGLSPTGPAEVRVSIPEGIPVPGRYTVTLNEHVPGQAHTAETHYAFEVRAP